MTLPRNRQWVKVSVIALITVVVGMGGGLYPMATTAVVMVAFAITLGLLMAPRLPKFFLKTLSILLIGYAFLGKNFAYVGISPLFVGEMVLGLGILAATLGGGIWLALRSPLSWLLITFMLWGAVCTVPYLGTFGSDALRDGVLWGYGTFALLVAAFLLCSGWLVSVPEYYRRLLPWFLLWTPVFIVISRSASSLPFLSYTWSYKPGDTAVHLAGVASFLVLGLHKIFMRQLKPRLWQREWVLWMPWLVGILVTASISRGGLVAVLVAALVVLLLRPVQSLSKWSKLVIIGLVVATVFFAFDIEIDVNLYGGDRKISPQQLIAGLQSIGGNGSGEGLESTGYEGTREWRLEWWSKIFNYTFFGEYFWTGKGFGLNLADADGFQVSADNSLRSPHNSHMTVLARAGVPGLVLWGILQGTFAISLLLAYFRARQTKQELWARLDLWVLAYWSAFMVNGAFDVFLEGPQGGIWFWSLFGFGIALLESQQQGGSKQEAGGQGGRGAEENVPTGSTDCLYVGFPPAKNSPLAPLPLP